MHLINALIGIWPTTLWRNVWTTLETGRGDGKFFDGQSKRAARLPTSVRVNAGRALQGSCRRARAYTCGASPAPATPYSLLPIGRFSRDRRLESRAKLARLFWLGGGCMSAHQDRRL